MTSSGSTAVPSDLLIFSPLRCTQPWPNTCRGSATPALISIAGQMTVWNRVMSLPMTCRSSGPPLREQGLVGSEADRADVVDQRIEPDIDDARRILRHRDAPGLPRATDRNVVEAALDQPEDLVAANVWCQELRLLGKVFQQAVLILRQAEEMILLANPVRFRPMNRTKAFDQILLLFEGFARDAIPTLVVAFIDIPGRGDPVG